MIHSAQTHTLAGSEHRFLLFCFDIRAKTMISTGGLSALAEWIKNNCRAKNDVPCMANVPRILILSKYTTYRTLYTYLNTCNLGALSHFLLPMLNICQFEWQNCHFDD